MKTRFIFICLLLPAFLFTQEQHPKKVSEHEQLRNSIENSRGNMRTFGRLAENDEGNARFLRWALHDGNLVSGGVINAGLLSESLLGGTPRIGWPKGTEWVAYLYTGTFYVAAEVVDADGDTIHIVTDHYREQQEISPDGTHHYAQLPLPKYFNLDQPEATEIPLIYGISEDVGEDGIPGTGDSGEGDGLLQPQEDFNANGILDLSMQNEVGWFAISHRKETWPEYWPAGSYVGDDRGEGEERPGVRAGRWNGEFGSYIRADQESYYVMDDRENDEFKYYPFDDDRDWPKGRRGLGLETEARTYQWNARLAEDLMICIFDVTNNGKDLEKSVVGMYVDPDLGGSFANDDAFFDDVDDITYAWNKLFRASNGLAIGYFGFAFLESPGLAEDGRDNDLDGLTDESQNNGIDDDGDWVAWEDANANGIADNEDLNYNGVLDPGEDANENGILDVEALNDDLGADGLGPEFFGYTGPDVGEANGVPDLGEPNFEFTDNDESDQVGLTSFYLRQWNEIGMANDELFWTQELPPGTFQIVDGYQGDISFTYGSGFVRFAGAEKTHRYAIALAYGNDFDDILRNKRTMQVIYDNDYNFAKPPLQPRLTATADDGVVYLQWDDIAERSRDPIYGFDFEAYYVYKATEPSFNEIKTISDAFGNPLLFEPLAIFDKVNGLTNLHPVRIGSELGPDSDLGVAYNMGTDSGLEHFFVDENVTNGRTYYYAIASIDQGYHPDFYPEVTDRRDLQPISPVESPVNIQTDSLGRPIAFDPNTAQVIPSERSAGYISPHLTDEGIVHVEGNGTGEIAVEVYSDLQVKTGYTYRVEFDDNAEFEEDDTLHYTGTLNKISVLSVNDNVALNIIDDPENDDRSEQFLFDGLRVVLHNDTTRVDSVASHWISGSPDLYVVDRLETFGGIPVARDYEIRVAEVGVDTARNGNRPVNFQVWDVTDPDDQFKSPFFYIDATEESMLSPADRIRVMNAAASKFMWELELRVPAGITEEAAARPQSGDVLKVVTTKTFNRYDAFEFTVMGNMIDQAKAASDLDNIYVVPDPYIGVSALERQVINEDEGRGDRQVDFVNLPEECTIHIFTSAGRLVRTLEFSSTEADNRRATWDLRTKDGLEISHGMYFFVVEAPGLGTKSGKFGIIK